MDILSLTVVILCRRSNIGSIFYPHRHSRCRTSIEIFAAAYVEAKISLRERQGEHDKIGFSYFHNANVRGQGTRHLVEGTLDPIVGCYFRFHILEYSFRKSQIRTAPQINSEINTRGNPLCQLAKLGNITANNSTGAMMITIIELNSTFTTIL